MKTRHLSLIAYVAALVVAPQLASAQTVIITATPAPAAPPPAAPLVSPASALAPAQATGQPCVMVLPNGQQAECPVIVIQAEQTPAQAVPPPPAAPTPAVAVQPYAGYTPYVNQRRLRRHRIRYTAGMQMPPGGNIVQRRHFALMIPGIALFASHYLAIVFVGQIDGTRIDAANYIPVIGPLLTLNNADYRAGRNIRIYDSIVQGVGLALFIAGMHRTAYVEWRADDGHRRSFALAPSGGPTGGSLNALLSF